MNDKDNDIINDLPESYTPVFCESEIGHIKKFGVERKKLNAPTILIVEDQDFSRRLLAETLRQYVCYVAENAKQAVALYAEHVPCIVFLDIELPDVSGHEVAALIKKYDPQSFIVMVTANSHEKDVRMAQENNVQGYIVKPFNNQKIMDAIQKYRELHHVRKRV